VATPEQIVSFADDAPPAGASALVPGQVQGRDIVVVDPDPAWPDHFAALEARVRDALGARVLALDHIGSTSVPGLAAKPIIDLDLVIADPTDEDAYVPALEAAGFVLRIREPWWEEHRMLRATDPAANLHVFGPDSPVPWRDRVFRDHLRRDAADRDLYAEAKRRSAAASTAAGEDVMEYNARKEPVIRAVFGRAFAAAGLPVVPDAAG
jgi:GrpB-like predicted nucleotidyltransferase (UPF0157 family)